jgi:hypothetical protein
MTRWQLAIPLTLVLAVAACVQNATPKPEPEPFVGAWRSSLQFENGAFAEIKDLEFMYVFNAGGTMTESSNYDGAPPVPPAYGVWRKAGPDRYELKYEYYSTAPAAEPAFLKGAGWLPSGRGVFTESIKLAADGKSFTSTMHYEAFDAQGMPAEGGGTAKGQAVRIGF